VTDVDLENMTNNRLAQLEQGVSLKTGAKAAAVLLAAKGYMKAGEMFDNAFARSEEMMRANVSYQDMITGLMGLGDNAKNPAAVNNKLLATSVGRGVGLKDAVDALYQLQSTAGNLPADVSAEIFQQAGLLTKVKGGSLAENQTALVKMWQNFPGAFKSPKEAASFLGAVEEKGSIDMAQLATAAPDAFAAWKEAGYSLKDFAASVQVATTYTGDVEKSMIQIRNLPGRLLKAEDVLGIKFKSGDYMERINQIGESLEKMTPDARLTAIKKIDEEQGLTVGSILTSRRGELAEQRAGFSNVGEDYLFEKYRERLKEPGYLSASIGKSILAFQESIPAMAAQEGESMKNTESYMLLRAGLTWANRNNPASSPEDIEKMAKVIFSGEYLSGTVGQDEYTAVAAEKIYNAKLLDAAGVSEKKTFRQLVYDAELLKLRQSGAFGLKDADGTLMDSDDLKEFQGLWDQGYSINAGQLGEYHRLGGGSSPRAQSYLEMIKQQGGPSMPALVGSPAPSVFGPGYDVPAAPAPTPLMGGVTASRSIDATNLAPMLLEASRNYVAATSALVAGARDRNSQVD
jgi:hypothetical protein